MKVVLHSDASMSDMLKAYVHGHHLSHLLSASVQLGGQLDKEMTHISHKWME